MMVDNEILVILFSLRYNVRKYVVYPEINPLLLAQD